MALIWCLFWSFSKVQPCPYLEILQWGRLGWLKQWMKYSLYGKTMVFFKVSCLRGIEEEHFRRFFFFFAFIFLVKYERNQIPIDSDSDLLDWYHICHKWNDTMVRVIHDKLGILKKELELSLFIILLSTMNRMLTSE